MKQEKSLISVVVCTYNQQDTIGRTLDSILMQQCHVPYEIVIGEDCSTDNTLAICQEYATKHPDIIRILANKPNKGVQDNYFDCVLAAHGQYIADCAGDDFWIDPLKLEKEVTIMETHPEVTLVHTDWQQYNETKGSATPSPKKPFTEAITKGAEMLEAIITQTDVPVIHLNTSLYRREIIVNALQQDESTFRNPDYGCEDVQVAFVEAQHGDIAYLSDVTLNYSQGHESVSTSTDYRKVYHFTLQTTRLTYHIAQQHHMGSTAIDTYFRQRCHALLMCAFRLHDKQMLEETLQYMKAWGVTNEGETRMPIAIMKSELSWGLALKIRHLFVSLKKLL